MEKVHEQTSWALLVGCFGILINNVIYYIYFCAQASRQFFVKERLESQKAARGSPRVFSFCINIGKFWVVKDLFSDHLCRRLL